MWRKCGLLYSSFTLIIIAVAHVMRVNLGSGIVGIHAVILKAYCTPVLGDGFWNQI